MPRRLAGDHAACEGLAQTLRVKVPIELPPVGIITLRSRIRTPACDLLMECLRQAAASP